MTKLARDGSNLGAFSVGPEPSALAFDGQSIWVASFLDTTVTRLALDGTELGTFPVGPAPVALAFDGESVWVANSEDNTISKLTILED